MAAPSLYDKKIVCMMYEDINFTYSRGIVHGHNPLHYLIPLILFQMILFFAISWTLYMLLRPLRQPRIVSNVLAGIIIGPSGLGRYTEWMEHVFPGKELMAINTMGSFANNIFIFLCIVKMDAKIIFTKQIKRDIWSLGLLCTFLPLGISYGLYSWLSESVPGFKGGIMAITASAVMSVSFLADVANGLGELKLLTSELGHLALGAATINDMIYIIITLVTVLSIPWTNSHLVDALVLMAAFVMFLIFAVRPAIKWIIKNSTPEGKPIDQFYVVAILLATLCMGVFSDALGMGFFPGVLGMGLVIPSGPPLGSAVVERTEFIINTLFMPFFYVRLGRQLDIRKIVNWEECKVMLLIIIAGIVAKFLATFILSFFSKMKMRDVFLLSLMLNFKGVLNFILFLKFHTALNQIDGQIFALLVVANLAMDSLATPLVDFFYKPLNRLETLSSSNLTTMSLQSTPSIGELRILSCIQKEDDVHGIITLIEASNGTPVTIVCSYVVHLLELVGRATPVLASYTKSGGHSSTDRVMRAFTNYSKSTDQSVTVQPFISIAPYKTMYENVCRLARAKHVPLIIVPFRKAEVGEMNSDQFRHFNVQMQTYAMSTVGILVNRGLVCVNSAEFSCKIAVIFLGGADDREALSLATRMSDHPCVEMSVMRIKVGEYRHEDEIENKLDDRLLEEFELKNKSNDSAQCLDVNLKEGIEIFNWIRSLENGNYDLIIVGKRQESILKLEGDMESWTENPELGTIGDMIGSEDFCGGTVSVLVMQHCVVGGGCSKKRSNSVPDSKKYRISSFSAILKHYTSTLERN
ncbi:Cation/H+ exchanger [Corchorus olitorius]|uniref:Cation/H+ exchanger n=1 Tax=Corchorus olitorius TaxID=93759 RepID=A0A1R3I007_9ROSI|nr:Cation/H+ exchanger [Corchorus olitorius]